MSPDHLAQTMRKLHVQYDFPQFVVVAHSMGGLVSRGFIQRLSGGRRRENPRLHLDLLAFDGHKAAETGVKTAPRVVRVWIDMSPGSDYLKSIFAGELGVPHYTAVRFPPDGGLHIGAAKRTTAWWTVASQLRPDAQEHAVRVEGFNETHMGILEAKEVSQKVNGLLAKLAR
jgi:pimeloyl-ACP methyl ester carboxylesterase